jgi:hypothetical protein
LPEKRQGRKNEAEMIGKDGSCYILAEAVKWPIRENLVGRFLLRSIS